MVFKNKLFFSSSKKSGSSSPDGSNSPRSTSNSPIRSDKKKPKASLSNSEIPNSTTPAFKQIQVKPQTLASASSTAKPSSSSSTPKRPDAKDGSASVSPLLASSLGLNRIKTRSGPLPQESFFSFRGEKSAAASVLGASNLSRPGGGSSKEKLLQGNLLDNVSNSDSMSTGSGSGGWHSREQSPVVQGKSRLQNGESSSAAGTALAFTH